MRGKVRAALNEVRVNGITPACAGKRLIGIAAALTYRDHPRVCGEKEVDVDEPWVNEGSPPRVRGKEEEFERI